MSEIFINQAKTASITGHRILDCNVNLNLIKNVFLELIEDGYDTFLVGMAIGFDTICFGILEEIRKEKNIKIIACVPCLNQAERFDKEQKKRYEEMLLSADEKVVLSKEYTAGCMKRRNDYMVNNSSCTVVYLRRDYGGTIYTARKAERKGNKIIYV